jgi:hypothetical protein
MPKQEVLDELEELLNIPQFEKMIFHRIGELKLYFEDEISCYRELRKQFKKLAYGKLSAKSEDKTQPRDDAFFFVLDEGKNSLWQVAEIAPPPRGGCTIQDILPAELIRIIVTKTAEPPGKEIQTIENLSLPVLDGMLIDLAFSGYSPTHILGVITRRPVTAHAVPGNTRENDAGNDYPISRNYMRGRPDVCSYFLMEFYTKIRPIVGGRSRKPALDSLPPNVS